MIHSQDADDAGEGEQFFPLWNSDEMSPGAVIGGPFPMSQPCLLRCQGGEGPMKVSRLECRMCCLEWPWGWLRRNSNTHSWGWWNVTAGCISAARNSISSLWWQVSCKQLKKLTEIQVAATMFESRMRTGHTKVQGQPHCRQMTWCLSLNGPAQRMSQGVGIACLPFQCRECTSLKFISKELKWFVE